MSEKTYVGKGKPFGQYGQLKLGIRVVDLKPNEKGYANLIVQEMRSPDDWGNTHTVYIDDWKPQPNGSQPTKPNNPAPQPSTDKDLPF